MKVRRATLAVALLLALTPAGTAQAASPYPFRNPRLPLDQRVGDLLGRLTLDEKVSLLHQYEPAIPRLGIKAFKTGTEALHGYAWTSDAKGNKIDASGTVFPQAVGLASTWDPALIKQVGRVVGTEARGYHSTNGADQLWGLNLWAPVVNLLRDPRWGRNEEGYSEDPTLTSAIATAYGKGMEGDDPDHLLTAPTLKHYLAYNNEVSRGTSDSVVPDRVLNDYDRKVFQGPLAAGAATGVMSSYNRVNGRPDVVNPDLAGLVRSWSANPLFNVTDAGSSQSLAEPGNDPTWNNNYYNGYTEGDAAIVKAGIDSFTQDNGDPTRTVNAIKDALSKGLLKTSDIDKAARDVLTLRFRLGEFDPDGGPYGKITASAIDTPASRALNRRTAAASMVLLKNSGGALPLSEAKNRKVAVVGPLSDVLYSDWYSPDLPYQVTPLDGIKARVSAGGGTVTSSEGVDRIALRDVTTGKYVTAGSGAAGAVLKEGDTTPAATSQFDVFDWGQGALTLRSAANGKYVGAGWSNLTNDQTQPNGWFVSQLFTLEKQPDGNYKIHYSGYETTQSWWTGAHAGSYVAPGPDGTLTFVAAKDAPEYARQVVTNGTDQAVAAVKGADTAVVVVGSMPFINGREAHDRTSMALADQQEALVRAVRKANPHTTVVLEDSYPTTITWEQQHVPSILWTTHAGAETGNALADVLFGSVNPSGRLTQTWYRSESQLPSILDYDIIKARRTYLYFTGDPLYAFGHGLSYTSFRYSGLRTAVAGDRVRAQVSVTNTGRLAGDEVVQLYTHERGSRDPQPIRELRTFQKVHLAPGETRVVDLSFPVSDLAHWDVTRSRYVVESGTYSVMVGAASDDIRQQTDVPVAGERIPARNLTLPTRAETFDDYNGVTLTDESKASGTSVGGSNGGWVAFHDVDLGRGATTFTAQVSKGTPGDGTIQIRLGSPTGRLLGTATVAGTGDIYTYATTTAALAAVTGRHDLYLVFGGSSGQVRLSTFTLR